MFPSSETLLKNCPPLLPTHYPTPPSHPPFAIFPRDEVNSRFVSPTVFFFFDIFIDYAITVVPFPPFTPLHPAHSLPPTLLPYSSCSWVIHICSLASTFPILFLPSPCLLSTYHLCYLFSVPFPPLSPADNPPCNLHFCDVVPVLVVGLVCFLVIFFRFNC